MYYAVRKGHTTGVFDNWPEAQAATSGFSGPEYKKFKTKEEAEAYLDNRDVWVEIATKAGYLVAFDYRWKMKDCRRGMSWGMSFRWNRKANGRFSVFRIH